MVTIRRSFHYAYPYFNLVLAGIVLLAGAMAWGVYLNAFGGFEEIEPGVFHAANIPEWHGVAWAYGLVLICILIVLPTHRLSIQWRERRRFRERFRPFPPDKTTRYAGRSIVAMVVSIVAIQLAWRWLELPESGLSLVLQGFIIVVATLYILGLFSVLPSYYGDIVEHLNKTDPRTNLRLAGNEYGSGEVRVFGRFQKGRIDYTFNIRGQNSKPGRPSWFGRGGQITIECTFTQLRGGLVKEAHIIDREKRWVRIRGKDLDDCFQQRFAVTGPGAGMLSPELKLALLNYPRAINLTLKPDGLTFSAVYTHQPPFYSREGMVMLWCDLLDWYGKHD
jgi:hypothetical protein